MQSRSAAEHESITGLAEREHFSLIRRTKQSHTQNDAAVAAVHLQDLILYSSLTKIRDAIHNISNGSKVVLFFSREQCNPVHSRCAQN